MESHIKSPRPYDLRSNNRLIEPETLRIKGGGQRSE